MSLLAGEMKVFVILVVLCATTYSACNCARLHALPLKRRYCGSRHTIVRALIRGRGATVIRPIAPGGAAIEFYGVTITRVLKGTDEFRRTRHLFVHADCGVKLKVGARYMLEVESIYYGLLHTPCGIAEFWNNTKWLRKHLRTFKNDPRVNCR